MWGNGAAKAKDGWFVGVVWSVVVVGWGLMCGVFGGERRDGYGVGDGGGRAV